MRQAATESVGGHTLQQSRSPMAPSKRGVTLLPGWLSVTATTSLDPKICMRWKPWGRRTDTLSLHRCHALNAATRRTVPLQPRAQSCERAGCRGRKRKSRRCNGGGSTTKTRESERKRHAETASEKAGQPQQKLFAAMWPVWPWIPMTSADGGGPYDARQLHEGGGSMRRRKTLAATAQGAVLGASGDRV